MSVRSFRRTHAPCTRVPRVPFGVVCLRLLGPSTASVRQQVIRLQPIFATVRRGCHPLRDRGEASQDSDEMPAKKPDPTADDLARAKRLQELVEDKGWNNAEFARQLHVTPNTASDLLRGLSSPKKPTLIRICRLFLVTPGWVLFGPPMPKKLAPGASLDVPAVPRRGDPAHPGLEQWLRGTTEGKDTSKGERAWLRALPWPIDVPRCPDEAYSLALQAFRAVEEAREQQ
jgi:transcriptional regulator with XRE-family HTH domain